MESKELTILAIDDNQDNLIKLQAIIHEAFPNAKILVAVHGAMGIGLAIVNDPDLILLNVILHNMDGFEICKVLKADKKLSDIPVVLISALITEKENRIKAIESDAEAFLTEPIDKKELVAQVQAMVKIRYSNKENRKKNSSLIEMVNKKNKELEEKQIETLKLLEDLKTENEARKKTESLLRESEWFFKESQKSGNAGSYKADFIENRWQSSDVLDTIFGIDENYQRTIKGWLDIIHPDDRNMMQDYLKNYVIKEGKSFNKEYRIIRIYDGELRWVKGWGKVSYNEKGEVISLIGTIKDITERKLGENQLKFSYEVLKALNNSTSLEGICELLVNLIKREMGYDAVGIRLKEGDDYPYFIQNGFSDKFLTSENSVIDFSKNEKVNGDNKGQACLECTCGLVISGQINSSDTLFTEAGSFYTNDFPALLHLTKSDDPRYKPRNSCICEGFLSVAIIPIRIDKKIVGTLQLNHRKGNIFNENIIRFFENLTEVIGVAINRKKAEDRLKESEDKYSKIFLTAPYAIGITSLEEGVLVEVNNAYLTLTGYTRSELINHSTLKLNIWTNPEDRQDVISVLNKNKIVKGKIIKFRRKNGDMFFGYFSAIKISLRNKEHLIFSTYDITEQELNKEKLEQTSEELREFAFHLMTVREDERKTVAREIHDELGQSLTSLKFSISWVKQHIHTDREVLERKTQELMEDIGETMKSFRRIYTALHPALLEDLGLYGALDWLVNSVAKSVNYPIEFITNIEKENIDPNKSLIIYRLVQESLTNIMRYANPTFVTLILNKEVNNILLEIVDNGIGFDISKVDTKEHHGILGIRERVYSVGGKFKINSVVGTGTTIKVSIPI